jgi:hypothetical protein
MKKYPANKLFHVTIKKMVRIKSITRETQYPFNLSFGILPKKSDNFRGPGIYLIAFRANLIYIGSYSSSKPNIIYDRWVKHIQSFTNRGYRLGFNSKSKIHLIPSKLKLYFEAESFRFCDTGTVTTLERLNFASEFYDEFKLDNNEILKDFTFYFHPLSNGENLINIESELISKYIPRCNSTGYNKEIKIIEITKVIDDIIKNYKDA